MSTRGERRRRAAGAVGAVGAGDHVFELAGERRGGNRETFARPLQQVQLLARSLMRLACSWRPGVCPQGGVSGDGEGRRGGGSGRGGTHLGPGAGLARLEVRL